MTAELSSLITELYNVQNGIFDIIGDKKNPRNLSTLRLQRSASTTRGVILGRILSAHTAHQQELDAIQHQFENVATAVGRVPDAVLLCIFTMARFQCDVAPEVLASVCHRWMAVVHGANGAPLWSRIDIILERQDEVIPSVERTLRHLDRSRNYPISCHLQVGYNISADAMDLLRSVVGASMSRCNELSVTSFHQFESLFPLDGPLILKKLEIRGSGGYPRSSGKGGPPALLPEGCPSLSELIIGGFFVREGYVSSILSNISQFAPITRLHLEVTDEVFVEVRDALGSFRDLEHLVWQVVEDDEEEDDENDKAEAAPLLLPKLKRLELNRHNQLGALSAPMLRCLKYNTPVYVVPGKLLMPVQFPNLDALWCSVEEQDICRVADVITPRPKLRSIWWRIPFCSIAECIGTLSSLMRDQPLLCQLDWFSIISDYQHCNSSTCGDIAFQLAKFAILRNELLASRRPRFKLCLDADLVAKSAEIACLVQKHSDIMLPNVHTCT